jgi:glycosyltransferase involved in cell wall biosynthesis
MGSRPRQCNLNGLDNKNNGQISLILMPIQFSDKYIDIFIDMKFVFHLLGFPHTAVNVEYNACAYTMKIKKFIKMMNARGHKIFLYANEGSVVPEGAEFVQIFTEEERASWFGNHDRQKQYILNWDPNEPYWKIFNLRAAAEIVKRARIGDFVLTLAGTCQQSIADQFPGSYVGIASDVMFVEYGIGYYGVFSRYKVFESSSHREWVHGRKDSKSEDNQEAVIPNYFDLDEFKVPKIRDPRIPDEPYYLFIGRMNCDKGFNVAVDVTKQMGARLVLAGQGDPGKLPPNVTVWGHATVEERAQLMTYAIASFAPTHYREPFGGVAVESQLCMTPAITTEHGAFMETVEPRWRCASHREFCDAALAAQKLTKSDKLKIKERAEALYSLEAVAPQYERYFGRLISLWGDGWYEMKLNNYSTVEDYIAQRGIWKNPIRVR